jgi:hypothetical protein
MVKSEECLQETQETEDQIIASTQPRVNSKDKCITDQWVDSNSSVVLDQSMDKATLNLSLTNMV